MKKLLKVSVLTLGLSSIFLMTGCIKKEPPKCSDKQTLSFVREIILGKIGGQGNLSSQEVENFLKIETPVASGYDEKSKDIPVKQY